MKTPDSRNDPGSDVLAPEPAALVFGPFILAPDRKTLSRGGTPVHMGGRALDILTALVEQPGQLLSKRELMQRVWPDTVVEDGNLKVHMGTLRRVLGDTPGVAGYIATVSGRGYRFVAPVRAVCSSGQALPSMAAAAPRHNLPSARATLFGREDAVHTLRRDLDASRVVSIVGPGGIGKTAVALAVAEQRPAVYGDGVWLVDLSLLHDASLVPRAIAMAMSLPVKAQNPLAALCEAVRDRTILIVLDSCEHLIDAVATCVDQLLSHAPGVKVLATSREPLQLSGERIRRLSGLDTPPCPDGLRAEEALAFPAVQLFVHHARGRLASFSLADAEAGAVADICQRLDGAPLAIALAAMHVDASGVCGLLRRLDDPLGLLAGRGDGPERHRTLAATLDWSFRLLPAKEAALLRDLSVFSDVFDVDGASAISGLSRTETAHSLQALVAKSLLTADVDGAGVSYRLLGTTRAYCQEQLHTSGSAQRIRERHVEHVAMLLAQAPAERARRVATGGTGAYGRMLDGLRTAR